MVVSISEPRNHRVAVKVNYLSVPALVFLCVRVRAHEDYLARLDGYSFSFWLAFVHGVDVAVEKHQIGSFSLGVDGCRYEQRKHQCSDDQSLHVESPQRNQNK